MVMDWDHIVEQYSLIITTSASTCEQHSCAMRQAGRIFWWTGANQFVSWFGRGNRTFDAASKFADRSV